MKKSYNIFKTKLLASAFFLLPFFTFAQLDLVLQTGHNSDIKKINIHPSENYFLSLDESNKIVVWDLNLNSQYASFSFSQEISDVVFYSDSLIAISANKNISFWNFKQNQSVGKIKFETDIIQLQTIGNNLYLLNSEIQRLTSITGTPESIENTTNLNYFHVSENENYIAGINRNNDVLINLPNDSVFQLKSKSIDVSFSEQENAYSSCGKKAIFTTYVFKDYHLEKSHVITNLKANHQYNNIIFNGNHAILGDKKDVVTVLNLNNGKITKQFNNNGGCIQAIEADQIKDLLIVGGEKGIINVYTLSDESFLNHFTSVSSTVSAIHFKDESTLEIGYNNGTVKEWNLLTHKITPFKVKPTLIDKIKEVSYSVASISDNAVILSKKDLIEFPSVKEKTTYFSVKNRSKGLLELDKLKGHHPSKNSVIKRENNEYLIVSNNIKIAIPSGIQLIDAVIHPSGNYIAASSTDGFIYWINAQTGIVDLKLVSPTDNSFFYITKDNYYFGSKTAMEFVGARLNEDLIGFEQIDLFYNRPDKVLSKLPFFNEEYLSLLEEAYNKRLTKLGLDKVAVQSISNLPKVETNLKELPLKTKNEIVALKTTVLNITGKYKLHILINGVPVFGKDGKTLESTSWNDEIQLSTGENKIQVFVEDGSGLKSLRQEKTVNLMKESLPNLYILSIGSGHFNDQSFNLNYAEKDANDITELFKNSNHFNSIIEANILGNNVTISNIEKEIEKLKNAGVNDVIIVFFAGHGVLDEQLDYYLSTSEIDFNSPQDGGLLFSNLEDKLSELQCRNKILFIDACHSGEIDKEEIELQTTSETEEGELVMFRNGTNEVEIIGGKSVFELSKNIFVDLRKNSGVITISSAGGAEFALEGKIWKNGAFTYTILKGLMEKEADLNGDKKIYINELQEYLFEMVPKLTNGMQTPTSRVEVLDQNIRVW